MSQFGPTEIKLSCKSHWVVVAEFIGELFMHTYLDMPSQQEFKSCNFSICVCEVLISYVCHRTRARQVASWLENMAMLFPFEFDKDTDVEEQMFAQWLIWIIKTYALTPLIGWLFKMEEDHLKTLKVCRLWFV